jgi:hypothetical protein
MFTTVYVAVLVLEFPFVSVALTVNDRVPKVDVSIAAPLATVPTHVATPDGSAHE